jgi:hypothetical protein
VQVGRRPAQPPLPQALRDRLDAAVHGERRDGQVAHAHRALGGELAGHGPPQRPVAGLHRGRPGPGDRPQSPIVPLDPPVEEQAGQGDLGDAFRTAGQVGQLVVGQRLRRGVRRHGTVAETLFLRGPPAPHVPDDQRAGHGTDQQARHDHDEIHTMC